eukprot:88912-Ditylum_brightwellii.AAC.1
MVGRRKRVMGGIAATLVATVIFLVGYQNTMVNIGNLGSESSMQRDLSVSLPNGDCQLTPAVDPQHQIEATFTASYPGSGAKMTWHLVEALTGYITGDEWMTNGHENMVTVKSHYPHPQGRVFKNHHMINRAIVILRNPKNAIPSYFNFLYEVKNHLEGHSTRAPVEAWVAWRDVHFDEEIQLWKEHLQYWLSRFDANKRLIMSYEGITDPVAGPIFATELSDFLRQSRGVPVIERESVPCIWKIVIRYRGDAAAARADQSRRRLNLAAPITPEIHRSLQEAAPVAPPPPSQAAAP